MSTQNASSAPASAKTAEGAWMKIGKKGRAHKLMVCEECGREGHVKEKCWKLMTCEECGRVGHPASNCRMRLVCETCGRNGHTADRCRTPFCSICGRFGHEDESCWKCDNCGGRHKTENCRAPKKWCPCCREPHDFKTCAVFARTECSVCGEVGKHITGQCNNRFVKRTNKPRPPKMVEQQEDEQVEAVEPVVLETVKVEDDGKFRWSHLFKPNVTVPRCDAADAAVLEL